MDVRATVTVSLSGTVDLDIDVEEQVREHLERLNFGDLDLDDFDITDVEAS